MDVIAPNIPVLFSLWGLEFNLADVVFFSLLVWTFTFSIRLSSFINLCEHIANLSPETLKVLAFQEPTLNVFSIREHAHNTAKELDMWKTITHLTPAIISFSWASVAFNRFDTTLAIAAALSISSVLTKSLTLDTR